MFDAASVTARAAIQMLIISGDNAKSVSNSTDKNETADTAQSASWNPTTIRRANMFKSWWNHTRTKVRILIVSTVVNEICDEIEGNRNLRIQVEPVRPQSATTHCARTDAMKLQVLCRKFATLVEKVKVIGLLLWWATVAHSCLSTGRNLCPRKSRTPSETSKATDERWVEMTNIWI